jgi:hypothetical protein
MCIVGMTPPWQPKVVPMNKKSILIALYPALLVAVALLAYRQGRNDVWISEFKVYQGNLIGVTSFHTQHSADLKEFLKGRYYYLGNRIPESWLGSPYDYGTVSTNVSDLAVGKGDTGARYEYQLFKSKHVLFREAKDVAAADQASGQK